MASASCDLEQLRARIRARARRLCAHINGAHADRVIERARRAGNRGLVMSYRPWLATSRVQDAIGHFAEAVAAYSLDHMDGFADALVQAYNCPLYFDDGHDVAITARRPTDAGLRLDLAFTCRETGRRTDIRDLTADDLFRLATSLLAPDRVLARAIGEVERFNASICSGADVHPLHRFAAHRARKAASDTAASRRAPASSHRREPSA